MNALARDRNQKHETTCMLPWAVSVYLTSLNAPPMAIEGMRFVLDACVSYQRSWSFLRDLSELVVRSYPHWWPVRRHRSDPGVLDAPAAPPTLLSPHCRASSSASPMTITSRSAPGSGQSLGSATPRTPTSSSRLTLASASNRRRDVAFVRIRTVRIRTASLAAAALASAALAAAALAASILAPTRLLPREQVVGPRSARCSRGQSQVTRTSASR